MHGSSSNNWAWFRIGAAILGLTGVLAGFVVNIDRATRQHQDLGLVLSNYFSFFTVISTLLLVTALLVAAAWSKGHPGDSPEPRSVAVALAATAGPVLLLGQVYNILLRGGPSGTALGDTAGIALLDRWAIEVLHVALPIYVLLDLLFAPRRRALGWGALAVIVGYPILWTTYTMVRGERVANPDGTAPWWYPYPFLDPHGAGGYAASFAYIGALTAAFVAIGVVIILIGRHRATRAAARGGAAPVGVLPA